MEPLKKDSVSLYKVSDVLLNVHKEELCIVVSHFHIK